MIHSVRGSHSFIHPSIHSFTGGIKHACVYCGIERYLQDDELNTNCIHLNLLYSFFLYIKTHFFIILAVTA